MICFQTNAITVSNSDVRTPCVASDFTSCLRSVNDVTSIRLEKPFQNLNSREVEKYPLITETRPAPLADWSSGARAGRTV